MEVLSTLPSLASRLETLSIHACTFHSRYEVLCLFMCKCLLLLKLR